jgi:hypothetical protein
MKSKRKTTSPARQPKAKSKAKPRAQLPKPKLKPKTKSTPKPVMKAKPATKPMATHKEAPNMAATVPAVIPEATPPPAASAASSTASSSTSTPASSSAPTSPSSTTSATTTPKTKATRNRKSHGNFKALAPYLATLPQIVGYDEYDLRGVESEGEMVVGANYDYAREALRQGLLRLPSRGQVLGAENLAKVIRDEPHLLSLPVDHGDVYYFEQMSYMVVIWKTYAPEEPFPPPFMSFIRKIRPDISKYYQPNPVISFMLKDDTPVRHKGSHATSDTIVTHIPNNQLRQPSLKEAIRAFTRTARASGAFGRNGKSRLTNDWLALTFHKFAQGNKDPKAYLRFPDQLRPRVVTMGKVGAKIYKGAFPKPYNCPLETTWSSAAARAEERIMELAETLMKLVSNHHITPTVESSQVGRWPVNEQPEPGCS